MPQGYRPSNSWNAKCVEAVRLTSTTSNREEWEGARAVT